MPRALTKRRPTATLTPTSNLSTRASAGKPAEAFCVWARCTEYSRKSERLISIGFAAVLCSSKAYNTAYAKGEQMINETMYARGAESSIIREIFSYGLERKAQIGAENVFDFSLGNPSVPAPAAVAKSIKKALELPSDQLHGYTPAPGLPQCRTAVAESLNRRFGTSYEGKDVFMTVGAAASLTCTLNAVTNPGDEVIVIAPYFPEYRHMRFGA